MIIELKIPSPGESISEVELADWFVENGDTVSKDQEVGEVESEKATLPLIAEQAGKIELIAKAGETLKVGTVVCKIDTSVKVEEKKEPEETKTSSTPKPEPISPKETDPLPVSRENVKITPLAKKMMAEENLSIDDVLSGLRKITAADIQAIQNTDRLSPAIDTGKQHISREVQKAPLSQLRKKISERLVAVKNETAMLTTFNELDMSSIMKMRKTHQDKFVEKHGVKLGFMSFFTKAVTLALKKYPSVNSFLEGNEIVSPEYCDIGIAVQTEKGLLVPVIRNAETLNLADIEKTILDIAVRARKNRISMDELSGGTFTITNGGIFGSMLSTPILNPPQSGILGMHNIIERPVAISGKVEIRPMMYIALSYDHRIIDGRDSVGFLKTVKEYLEDPSSMLFGNSSADALLLNL